jgi:hypothetical protein
MPMIRMTKMTPPTDEDIIMTKSLDLSFSLSVFRVVASSDSVTGSALEDSIE